MLAISYGSDSDFEDSSQNSLWGSFKHKLSRAKSFTGDSLTPRKTSGGCFGKNNNDEQSDEENDLLADQIECMF